MENKKNNKGLIAIIIILSICVVGLVGYNVYDKLLTKEETKEDIVSTTIKKEEQSLNLRISVEDAINIKDEYYNMFYIKIPKIVGNNDNIEKLNKKIINDILPGTYIDLIQYTIQEIRDKDRKYTNVYDKGKLYDYKYWIKENILILNVYSYVPEGGTANHTGEGNGLDDFLYFYDINNNIELTFDEANKIFKYSSEDYSMKFVEYIDKDLYLK